jgi:hypothetical protein
MKRYNPLNNFGSIKIKAEVDQVVKKTRNLRKVKKKIKKIKVRKKEDIAQAILNHQEACKVNLN